MDTSTTLLSERMGANVIHLIRRSWGEFYINPILSSREEIRIYNLCHEFGGINDGNYDKFLKDASVYGYNVSVIEIREREDVK